MVVWMVPAFMGVSKVLGFAALRVWPAVFSQGCYRSSSWKTEISTRGGLPGHTNTLDAPLGNFTSGGFQPLGVMFRSDDACMVYPVL